MQIFIIIIINELECLLHTCIGILLLFCVNLSVVASFHCIHLGCVLNCEETDLLPKNIV